MWLSLVERLVRDQEAGGSNPLIPTIFNKNNGYYFVWEIILLKGLFFYLRNP